MSPEQVRGEELDARTDLFSFGLVLYEMATGHPAFPGNTSGVITEAILNRAPTPLTRINPDLPSKLEEIINKALEKDRKLRYQHASDLRTDLRRLKRDTDSGRTPVAGTGTSAVPQSAKARWIAVVVAVVVFAALAVSGFYFRLWRSRESPKINDKDTIVIANFTNSTSEPIFGETLKDALGVSLRQSSFLDIASDEKVIATLRLMTKPVDTALTPQVAREVCQRTQGKAYITGSIASLGSEYVLGLKAVNCANGDVLAQEQVTAAGKDKVLEALGNAASRLRGKLGESLVSVQKSNVPLEQLTTSSLEAFEAYSRGAKAQLEGKGDSVALSYFLRAIELDPNFTHAYSSAGVMYRNLGDYVRSNEYITKAYALRDRASAYENLLMQADYYHLVIGDDEKSLPLYEQLTESYPHYGIPWGYLAGIYSDLGQLEKASVASQRLIQLQPRVVFFYPMLVSNERSLGRISDAHRTYDLAVSRGLDSPDLRLERYLLAFVEEDTKAIAEQVAWFEKEQPDRQFPMLLLEANTEAYRGHERAAQQFTSRASATAKQARNPVSEAFANLDAAWREAALGNVRGAAKQVTSALHLAPENQDVESSAAEVLARTGDRGRALKLAQDLAKRFPQNTVIQRYRLPRIHAQLALAAKKPTEAVEQLRVAEPMEARSCKYSYDRGEAYLEAGQGTAAAAAFQQILDHPGLVGNCLPGALARLQLGRAFAMQGDTPKARAAYQDFLALWKDADSDISIFQQAKAEYAKLN
jgi:predicted Zn-dependent protease